MSISFTDKSFVITGTFKEFERKEIEEIITSKGGVINSSVSSKTDYLICGEKAGSKLDKAKSLGIEIVDEEEFKKLLNVSKLKNDNNLDVSGLEQFFPELKAIKEKDKIRKFLDKITDFKLPNECKELPESIGLLSNLQNLNLYFCKNLTSLPESIGNLTKLQSIDLYFCENLSSLPESIGNLTNLQSLILCDCYSLNTLPESISKLTNLEVLDLRDCHNLTTLPENIGNLKKIEELDLTSCVNLTDLPKSINKLKNSKIKLPVKKAIEQIQTKEFKDIAIEKTVELDHIDGLITTIKQNGKWAGFIDLKTKKKIDTIEQLVEAIKTNCDKKFYIGYSDSDFVIIINFKELPLVKKFLNLDKNSISLSEIRIDNIDNITTYYAEIDIKEPVIKSKKITAEEVLELSLKGMLDFEIMKQDTYGTEISGGYLNINFNFSGINFFISAVIDDDFQHNNSDDYVSLEYVSDCEVRAKVYYKGGDAGGWDWAECFSNSLNEFFETVPDNEDFNMTELLEEWEDNYEEGDFYSEAESGGNTDYSFRYLDVYFTDYTFKEDMLNLEKEFLKRYYPKQLSEDEMDKIIQKFNINNEELLAELESKLWDSI